MKKTICLALIVLIAAIAAGCAGGAATAAPPGYLRLVGPEPVTLDPHLITDAGSHIYVGKIFAGLLKLDLAAVDRNNNGNFSDQGEPVGLLTTEDVREILQKQLPQGLAFIYDFKMRGSDVRGLFYVAPDLVRGIPEPVYNPDETISYTFELRDDAVFRNGREITAWDFAYSFDRAADPKTMSSTAELYLQDILGVWEMLYERDYQGKKLFNRIYEIGSGEAFDISKVIVDLPGVKAVNSKTLKITTKNVLPVLFYFHMTYPAAAVVDKVQVDASPRSWIDNPNGAGPYRLESKNVGQIVLRANKLYYGFQPRIDKIIYDISGGSTVSSYQNNEIDISGIGVADLQSVGDPVAAFGSELFEATEMSISYIGLNTDEPPFDDVKVRQALAMAINKEWLAKEVLVGLALPANGVLPPGMPGYRKDLKGLPFDPQKARELLAQSKYGGPEGLPRIKLTISGSGSAPSVVLQGIIEMWRTNLGVEVTIESIDYVTFLEQIKKGQFQMFSLGWVADYPDPEDFLDLKLYSKRSRANNETGYRNLEFDKLIERARTEKDPQKRISLYQQAEDIVIKDAPWILLFHSKGAILAKPYIHDYFPTPMGISTIQYMYIE